MTLPPSLANNRRLDRWVAFGSDGTVEALVSGDDATVVRLIAWARQGPDGADVSQVEVELAEEAPTTGFHQQPTA